MVASMFLRLLTNSNMTILSSFKKSVTIEATANIFFEHVVYFELEKTIVFYRGNKFLSIFWSNLWPMMDTKLTKSTTFHSQTDG
jgi:hypothetical protein